MLPTVKRLNRTLLVITAMAALPMASTATALAGPVPAKSAPAPAPAAKTWTVQPGGAFTGASAGALKITDTAIGVSISCKSASIGGTLESGSGLPAHIGTITSSTIKSGSCGIGLPVRRDAAALDWSLTAASYNAGTGVTSGTIGHVHVAVSSGGCAFTVDGTGASADDGTVNITYANGTHDFKILPGTGNLHIYHPSSGCAGLIHNGDKISEAVTYTLTPAQKITSP